MKNLNRLIYLISLFSSLHSLTVSAQVHPSGVKFDDSSYMQVPEKAKLMRSLDTVPARASIKAFAPWPKDQGTYNTCTAWSCAYCARTMIDAIRNNWSNKDSITAHAYSPAFLFRLLDPIDDTCGMGTDLQVALSLMKRKGLIRYADMPLPCAPSIDSSMMSKAASGKVRDFARLFDIYSTSKFKIQAVKKSISEHKPVVLGMLCPLSFQTASNCWQPTEDLSDKFISHSVCVVSYDDTLYKGAFEIQNSWGTSWGNGGYLWIKYDDFAKFTRYGYELIDIPQADPLQADLTGSIKLFASSGDEMTVKLKTESAAFTGGASPPPGKSLPIYETDSTYKSKTDFRFYISNGQPAYVYAIGSDPTNESNRLFPSDIRISAALTYKKNAVAIPDERKYIEVDEKPGNDILCILYSRNEVNVDKLVDTMNAATGSFNERLMKALGDRMVDASNINADANKITFKGYTRGKDLVAITVDVNHK